MKIASTIMYNNVIDCYYEKYEITQHIGHGFLRKLSYCSLFKVKIID